MRFRVQLDAFCGPFDLLLYLVRRHELDVLDLPLAMVADQYLEILSVLEQLDVDAAGDFLEVASRLMELKSQLLLPKVEDAAENEEALEDPRNDLVRRLLEYKRYKEAAGLLEDRARLWQLRFPRRQNDLDDEPRSAADQPIQDVELWDLVSAFARVMREKNPERSTKIRYDETPIEVHMRWIEERLAQSPRLRLADLFEAGMHRVQMVGLFLALLELIRHGRATVEQAETFGDIWISGGTAPSLEVTSVAETSPSI